jgi:hypothetical protein
MNESEIFKSYRRNIAEPIDHLKKERLNSITFSPNDLIVFIFVDLMLTILKVAMIILMMR